MQFSPISYHLIPLRFKYSPQHPCSQIPLAYVPPLTQTEGAYAISLNFQSIQNDVQNYDPYAADKKAKDSEQNGSNQYPMLRCS
jgi:hypothetical protein